MMKSIAMKDFFYRMLCGFLLGITIIAPGVSTSVMAVIMGIYSDLIEIVSNPFRNIKKNVLFLIPMGIGAVLSMIISLQILRWLFANYPTPAYLLFIGLIAGGLPTVLKEANSGGFKKRYIFAIIGALSLAVTIGMLAKFDIAVTTDPSNIVYLTICGGIVGIASMTPGMSISMILMMLGVYEYLLEAASSFDIKTILPVILSFAVGMVAFSNLTKYIFKRFHGFGYFMVSGFMMGSIICIFPVLPKDILTSMISIAAILLGLFISFLFQRLGKNLKKEEAAVENSSED